MTIHSRPYRQLGRAMTRAERWQRFKSKMTEDQRTRRRESKRRSYYLHRDKILQTERMNSLNRRAEIREIKSKIGCSDCGESDGFVLEFFRIDPNDHDRDMRSLPSCTTETILSKVSTRLVLCRNCRERRVISRREEEKKPDAKLKPKREALRSIVASYKANLGCKNCAEKDSRVLHFHHPGEKGKGREVSKLLDYGLNVVFAEIDKCVLLCANCHRRVHAKQNHEPTI